MSDIIERLPPHDRWPVEPGKSDPYGIGYLLGMMLIVGACWLTFSLSLMPPRSD